MLSEILPAPAPPSVEVYLGVWVSGDPLYFDPRITTDDVLHQYVRPLFELIRECEKLSLCDWECKRCLVGWSEADGPMCWSCGKPGVA